MDTTPITNTTTSESIVQQPSTLRRASSYDAYASLLGEIHGRIKLGLGAMYETSKTKLVRDKRKPQLLPHQPQQLKFQSLTTRSKTTIFEGGEEEEDEETGDVVSGDENDDDLGWEYQDSPSAPEEDILTFRSDLNYEFMNDQEFRLIEQTNAIIKNRSLSTSDSLNINNTSSLPSTSSHVLNETFQDHLNTSTMLVDLHLYYLEHQQRRISDGLALQDIGEFIRDHVDDDESEESDNNDKHSSLSQIINTLKSSSTVDELALSRKMQKSLSVEGFKTEPGFLRLKVPDIALAADSLTAME